MHLFEIPIFLLKLVVFVSSGTGEDPGVCHYHLQRGDEGHEEDGLRCGTVRCHQPADTGHGKDGHRGPLLLVPSHHLTTLAHSPPSSYHVYSSHPIHSLSLDHVKE